MAGRKENLKALFTNTRTRVIIVFTVVLLLLAVIIGLFRLFKAVPEELAPSARLSSTPGIASVPGSQNPTPQYAKLQDEENRIQAEEAEKTGASALPTIIRTQALGEGMEVVGAQGGETGVGFVTLSQGSEKGVEQSLWIQQIKEANCDKASLEKATNKGLTLTELKGACTCLQLKNFGYALKDLIPLCTCKDLKESGYKVQDLKNAGFTATRLRACGFIACEMRSADVSALDLMNAGYTPGELKGAGYSEVEITQASGLPASIQAEDVLKADCESEMISKLRQSGVSASAIRRISGCDSNALKQARYSATDLKNAGFSAAELKRNKFTPYDLKQAGFTARDLLNAGATNEELTMAGYSPADIQVAEAELPPGTTAEDVKAGGCDVDVLTKQRLAGVSAAAIRKEAGCELAALKAAGFSDGSLGNAGFSLDSISKTAPLSDEAVRAADCDSTKLKQLLAKGVSARRIKNLNNCDARSIKDAGFAVNSLLDAGFAPEELRTAGFTQYQIEKADITPSATIAQAKLGDCSPESLRKARDAGVSAQTIKNTLGCPFKSLKDAGYSLRDLKDAGFSVAELKKAGFSLTDLKNVNFDPKTLKEVGFSKEAFKQAGFNDQQLAEAGFTVPGTSLTGLKEPVVTEVQTTVTKSTPPPSEVPNVQEKQTSLTDIANSNKELDKVLADQNKRMAEQRLQENISQRASTMQTVATQYLQTWSQVDAQVYEAGTDIAEKAAEGTIVPAVNGNPALAGQAIEQTTQVKKPPIIKAGDILYAVIDTSVNSDEPGPILATIVSPKLKGTRLIGTFNLPSNADKMVINFNTMSVPGAVSTTGINAYAIDSDTARTALSSRTDHHYLMRYGSLFASSFIEGLGNAIETANTKITLGGTGGLTETTVQNNRSGNVTLENAVIALATVGKNWGQQAQQLFNRPTTVEVFSGTPIGVLFMQDLATI